MPKLAPAHLLLAFLALLTMASVMGLPGLMVAHGGTAGAHLFSIALNSLGAPLFLHADMLYANGTLEPYNHHPPLFFWLQALVTAPFTTTLGRLTAAYYFSAAISAATLIVLYAALRRFGIGQMAAALAVAAITGTRMYATYRGFITFDVVSPLLATLFILAIAQLETKPTPRHIRHFLATGIFALLISWYAVTVIAVYLGTKILINLNRHGLRTALTTWPCACAAILGTFFVAEVALLLLQEYLATGQLHSFQASLGRQENLNAGMLPEPLWFTALVLVRRVLESLPLIPLAALALLPLFLPIRKIRHLRLPLNPLVRASLYVAAGAALFIALTPVWSKVHPFAFLWFGAPLAVGVATLLPTLPASFGRRVLAPAIILAAPLWLAFGYYRDHQYATATRSLFTALETFGPSTYHFIEPTLQCGKYTSGNLTLIGAWPNRWLQPVGSAAASPGVSAIMVNCPVPGILVFTPPSGDPVGAYFEPIP